MCNYPGRAFYSVISTEPANVVVIVVEVAKLEGVSLIVIVVVRALLEVALLDGRNMDEE